MTLLPDDAAVAAGAALTWTALDPGVATVSGAGVVAAVAPGTARVVAAVDRPVNVLLMAATPTVPELAELGTARVSLGGALARTAYGTVRDAARALRETGRYPFSAS